MSDLLTIVFDVELRRPACAIVNAVLGGDHAAPMYFDPETWLVAPTPGMRPFRVRRETIESVAKQLNAEWRQRGYPDQD